MNKKHWIQGLLVLLTFMGLPSQAFFDSKEALFEKLYEREFQYVIEIENKVIADDHTISKSVIDLSTGQRRPYSIERIEALDYKVNVNKVRRWVYGEILAKAYSVSDVMVCYFYGDTVIYKDQETCIIFPHSVKKVVEALSS